MAFIKTKSYYENKIANIKKAIIGTKKAMKILDSDYQIQAHKSQIESYKQSLIDAKIEFSSFMKKEGNK